MEEEMMLFVIPKGGKPMEFSLNYLLETNFAYHDSKEENVKDLNEFIQAIVEYRDNLLNL